MSDFWLSDWTLRKYQNYLNNEDGYYLLIYSILGILSALLFIYRAKLFTHFTVSSSKSIF